MDRRPKTARAQWHFPKYGEQAMTLDPAVVDIQMPSKARIHWSPQLLRTSPVGRGPAEGDGPRRLNIEAHGAHDATELPDLGCRFDPAR